MIANLLLLVPQAGSLVGAGWRLFVSPAGRRVAVFAIGIAGAFAFGWSLKARLDRTATLQAIVLKQRIDLEAARQTAEQAAATAVALSDAEQKNQEVIRGLERRLAALPQNNACSLDDTTARSLRRLR